MKVVQQISLLALALTLASCNEKVSPELQNASVTTGGATSGSTSGSGSGTDVNYSFKVTNTADPFYNMKLHKTGDGNANVDCEVKSTNTPFSNRSFGDPAVNDITCYLDAEELSLAFSGPKFKVEATANTCEFVTYKPFYFYNRQPGDSTGIYKTIKCMNDDTTNAHVASLAGSISVPAAGGIQYDPDGAGAAGLTNAGCGDYFSISPLLLTPTNVRNKFTVADPNDLNTLESESQLCRFNYEDGDKEKCDIGKITIEENQVTYDLAKATKAGDDAGKLAAAPLIANYSDTVDGDGAGVDDGTSTITAGEQGAIDAAYNAAYTPAFNAVGPTVKKVVRTVMCGGKVANCVKGPLKEHSELSPGKGTLYISGDSKSPTAKEFTYPSIIASSTTIPYVNYRRELASNIVDYISPSDPNYATAFIDQKVFDPKAIEQYAKNLDYDGTVNLIGPAYYDANSTENLMFSARPLAADSILGLAANDYQGTPKYYPTNPFYTFECLDTAREPKARIRMVIREWDRIFPTGLNANNLELLSDIYFDNSIPSQVSNWSRQDNTTIDPNSGDFFNDYTDWDDMIGYQKTSIPPYYFMPVNGFFDKQAFPNLVTPE